MSKNVLLISPLMLKERTSIHGNTDDKLLEPDIKYCQDTKILPILGTALYIKMQSIIADGSILTAPLVDYKTLLDDYIVDALMYYTLSKLPMTLSYQFWNKGIIRKQGENTDLPSMSDLFDIGSEYINRAEYYGNRLKLFVIDQSSRLGKYPEYLQPGSTVDTINPQMRQFSTSIYLGTDDKRDNPWCNEGGFNGQPYKP